LANPKFIGTKFSRFIRLSGYRLQVIRLSGYPSPKLPHLAIRLSGYRLSAGYTNSEPPFPFDGWKVEFHAERSHLPNEGSYVQQQQQQQQQQLTIRMRTF
jgi:hypothetical protein